jgi:hypothetical protein
VQFEQATSMHVQIILLSAYLAKMIGKDEIRRNQFVKRNAIGRKHSQSQAFLDERNLMYEVTWHGLNLSNPGRVVARLPFVEPLFSCRPLLP